jgi:hypothetical protein
VVAQPEGEAVGGGRMRINLGTGGFAEAELILCRCHGNSCEKRNPGIDFCGGVRAEIRTRRKA